MEPVRAILGCPEGSTQAKPLTGVLGRSAKLSTVTLLSVSCHPGIEMLTTDYAGA